MLKKNNFISKLINNQKVLLLFVMTLVILFSFWNKGSHNLQEWDESRNGVNAYEMLQNKDYVNFYYNNKLDTWNAKPPLMIWLITLSYKAFGFNEFALRFPSTLVTLLFFILCFYTITLLDSSIAAFITCLILISTKAIFGNHIGLTGDFDALLLLFLTASVFSFILYLEKRKTYAIYLVALMVGMAFYTKGPAAFVLMPGLIAYLIFRKEFFNLLKDKHFWFALTFLIAIVFSWFLIVYLFGKTSETSVYGSKNSIETLLIHDTYKRLTSKEFEPSGSVNHSPFFFFQVLDSRLNLWNYLFYFVLLSGIYLSIKKKVFFQWLSTNSSRFTLLSLCLIFPLSLILNLSVNQHNWYMAPTFMFIAFLTAKGLLVLGDNWKPVYLVTIALLIFTLFRQTHYIYTLDTDMHEALTDNAFLKNKKLIVTTGLKQDVVLYLKWLNVEVVKREENSKSFEKGALILSVGQPTGVRVIQEFGGYTLGVKE